MSSEFVIEEVVRQLARRFGSARRDAKARILTFGPAITCSINYSKLLHGNKYIFGLPPAILNADGSFAKTEFGEFVLLVCGSADKILVLPRPIVVGMMRGVGSRRLDIFVDSGTYIFQTTKHPKCDVTEYLNAFPVSVPPQPPGSDGQMPDATPDRVHVKIQFALIALGRQRDVPCGFRPAIKIFLISNNHLRREQSIDFPTLDSTRTRGELSRISTFSG